MGIFASWSKKEAAKVMKAVVVTCLDCNKKDSVNSEDKEWRCPECKKLWKVSDLIWRR